MSQQANHPEPSSISPNPGPHCRCRKSASALQIGGAALALLAFSTPAAQAVPSFARQTGVPCTACHVGGFGPQLTAFGRRFKILGYTMGKGPKWVLPLSAMVVNSYDSTKKGVPGGVAPPRFEDNNNFPLDEASLFLAGKITDHLGMFVQGTYSGIDRASALDNVDIRYARKTKLGGKSLIVGVSLNNNPTIQDPWNSTPAWGFPFTGSELAPAPGAGTLINGGLEMQVLGTSAYAYYNDALYVEVGQYSSLSPGFLNSLGIAADAGKLSGVAPYWRVALNRGSGSQNFSIGAFGMNARLLPNRIKGLKNKFSDLGFDGTYQYFSGKSAISANARYVHESQTLNFDFAAGSAARRKNHVNSFTANAAYYYKNTYGVTLGYFNTWGGADNAIYAPNDIDGSRDGKPNASGYVFQADVTPLGKAGSWAAPWVNLRVGLQYTAYDKFNGARKNYDGAGRNASDNNTLFLFSWLAF